MSTTNKKKRTILILTAGILIIGTVAAVMLARDKSGLDYTVYPVEHGVEQGGQGEGHQAWGYDITYEGKTVIHQPHVPAIGGMEGFADKKTAEKVALVILGIMLLISARRRISCIWGCTEKTARTDVCRRFLIF